jgi:plasmid stabilization system protein ParE
MEVKWLTEAEDDLEAIFDHYLSVAGEKTATKIVNRILDYAEILGRMPLAGAVELFLEDQPEGYRRIVVKRLHKIIYFIADGKVNISTIFDCRRDPAALRASVLRSKDNS